MESEEVAGLRECSPEHHLKTVAMKEKAHLFIRGGTDYTKADIPGVHLSLSSFGNTLMGITLRCLIL